MVECCERYMWKSGSSTVDGSISEKEVYIDDIGFVKVFGIRLKFTGSENGTIEIDDISSIREKAEKLLELMRFGEVSIAHVYDVAEDFIID